MENTIYLSMCNTYLEYKMNALYSNDILLSYK